MLTFLSDLENMASMRNEHIVLEVGVTSEEGTCWRMLQFGRIAVSEPHRRRGFYRLTQLKCCSCAIHCCGCSTVSPTCNMCTDKYHLDHLNKIRVCDRGKMWRTCGFVSPRRMRDMNFLHPGCLVDAMDEDNYTGCIPFPSSHNARDPNWLHPYRPAMPSRTSKISQKPARKQKLSMPQDDEDSELDEFETDRKERGMYDDSDEESEDELAGQRSDEDEEGSEAESSEMARQRFQGWQADELDGQEEEFTEESGDDSEISEDDNEEEAPRKRSKQSDQDRLANLRKGELHAS
jgi:hypothetical protein